MASFNKVILLGNLTRDPEVRYTPKGSAVADLGIAVNRQYTLENGEKREEVTFVDVTFWGRTAEVAGEYLKKGRPVFIVGPAPARHLGRQTVRTKAEQAESDRRNDANAGKSPRWWRC
jgi:single stranded DNA-binding protein (ssb)